VGAHDHRPYTTAREDLVYLNGGARCGNVGHAVAELTTRCRKVTAKKLSGEIVRLDKNAIDPQMKALFDPEFRMVKEFTVQKVGRLEMPLVMRESYAGMCDYMNLLHTVQVSVPEADLSFAAPLTFNGYVNSGDVIFNDLFTIYPFENQLFVMKLKGSEVKSYLEYSYDTWIQTPGDHVLRIVSAPDPRNGTERYSFVNRSYNFDSAGGLNYTVDVTKPAGSRVAISSLADGSVFDPDAWYNVAMTSYRASGGGNLMREGAGIDTDHIDELVVERYPEIRNIIYDYLMKNGSIDPETIGDASVIGRWKFIPEALANKALDRDMSLLFK
ncbi:MAG: 5'-nucleotidase C-terminal domain-containing protein, partial [Bacteroidales bacterium]|nr:5'-nucleotidase C-terminal domain-containing protein [Bacteroidales bacterium]